MQESRYRVPMSNTIGLILAGGRSARMQGQDKAFVTLAGKSLLVRAIEHLAPQVHGLAISSNRSSQSYSAIGLPVIPDRLTGFQGPLAGIHAGLCAYPKDYLISIAVDLPFLPKDLVARLHCGMQNFSCAYASCGTQHALALLWAPGMAQDLEKFMQQGNRSLRAWLAGNAGAVFFEANNDSDILININTPEDLRAAEQRLTLAACQKK